MIAEKECRKKEIEETYKYLQMMKDASKSVEVLEKNKRSELAELLVVEP